MLILLVVILHCDKISIPNKDFLKHLSLNPNGIFNSSGAKCKPIKYTNYNM